MIPRVAASSVPLAAVILLSIGGRRLGELTLLWGGVVLLLLAVSAVLSYMLWNGQFPPRISTQGSDLPAENIRDSAASLDLLETSLREVGARIRRIEAHVGVGGDEE